jgi:outer membrane protein insertion porin family
MRRSPSAISAARGSCSAPASTIRASNIALGGDIFRRDYNSFNYIGSDRQTTYGNVQTGASVRLGVPLTEFWQAQLRYSLIFDDVSLAQNFFTNGRCDPFLAGRYLCDAIGQRTNSAIGYTLAFDNTNNRIRPSAGNRLSISQDFAGLGGSVRYLKTMASASKYWKVFGNFILSTTLEGGHIFSFNKQQFDEDGTPIEKVRITDRFFLGEGQVSGFDIRGIGPRVQRLSYDSTTGELVSDRKNIIDDALGGRTYYRARAELEIPLGSGAKEMGLRPSVFVDVGAVFGLRSPKLTTLDDFPKDANGKPLPLSIPILDSNGSQQCLTGGAVTPIPAGGCPTGSTLYANTIQPFEERFLGNSPKPRVSVGFGVNWNSPFGPFRIDIAKALIKEPGDDTKLFTFNVGTQF